MYDRILIAVDGSPTAGRALGEVTQLARKLGSELVTTRVVDNSYLMYDVDYVDVGAFIETLAKQGNQIVADARVKVEKVGARVHSAMTDDPIGTFGIDTVTEQAAYNVGAQAPVPDTRGRRGF